MTPTQRVSFEALAVRALKTFVQAFVAVIVLNLSNVATLSAGKSLAVSAVAAGLSAVMNLFLAPQEAK